MSAGLLRLPPEILHPIAIVYLDTCSFMRLASACSSLRTLLADVKAAWFHCHSKIAESPLFDGLIPRDANGYHFTYNAQALCAKYGWSIGDWEFRTIREVEILAPTTPPWGLPADAPDSSTGNSSVRQLAGSDRKKVSRSLCSRLPLQLGSPTAIYFEVCFSISEADSSNDRSLDAMIGLVSSKFRASHLHVLTDDTDSICFESIDGMLHIGAREGEWFQFAPKFNYGDVVGCGIIANSPETPNVSPPAAVFFTLNGHWVGDTPTRVTRECFDFSRTVFPAIAVSSADCPVDIQINMGRTQPFVFDMEAWVASLAREGDMSLFTAKDIPSLKNHIDFQKLARVQNELHTEHSWRASKFYDTHEDFAGSVSVSQTGPVFNINFRTAESMIVVNAQDICPISMSSAYELAYFEVHILACGLPLVDDPPAIGFVSVGLARRPYSPFRHVGWEVGSLAYHSDDGNLFDGAGKGGFTWSDPYEAGEVIGCGMTPRGDVYFTKNGKLVGPRRTRDENGDDESQRVSRGGVGLVPAGVVGKQVLFPTIGACYSWDVAVHVSPPFLFADFATVWT
ncbi:hypothetical protein HDU83_002015 [Entophlyctis luteolus]|nr:hypothetical protein HDU83_002015 [Entophlyctis luteolus]